MMNLCTGAAKYKHNWNGIKTETRKREQDNIANHALVLCLIAQQPRIAAREIAATVGITEKATRNIINDLEADDYITKTREGRCIRYGIDPEMPLRHEIQEDKAVGDLLEVLGWAKRYRQGKSMAH